jgi:CRP/FNR family transcriptional regulator, cyclic AMP receptor protein
MPSLIPDVAAFERRLAGLPVVKHPAHEVVLTAGSKTGRLFFLKSGAVEVIKDGVQIANVSAPGSVFGDQAVLLDQPHTADVRTLEQSEFYVADAPAMFAGDPTVAALYVAAILPTGLAEEPLRSVFGSRPR